MGNELSLVRAISAMPEAAEVTDAEGRIVAVNAAYEELSGLSAADVLGRGAEEAWGAEDEIAWAAARREVRAGTAFSGVLAARHRSGAPMELSVTMTPLTDELGVFAGALCLRRETAPLAPDEQDLLIYRQLFQNNTAIKLLIDPMNGKIEDANPAAATFYGHPVDALRRMNIQEINVLPPEEIREEMQLAASERRTYFRFTHRLASGELRRVEVFSGPVVHHGRHLLFSVVHDVTDREIAQEALMRSEARLRALVQQIPVGIAIHREGRLFFANDTAAQILGFSRGEELVGRPILELVHPADRASVAARVASVTELSAPTDVSRHRLLRKDGTMALAETRAMHLAIDGAPAVVTIAIDVTERERAEEQLRQSQRMEAVGRLAGGIAHDFNNLLFVILNSVKLVARKLPQADSDLEQIDAAAHRAADLTKQLLLFSRGGEARAGAVDLNSVITGIVRLLRGTLGEHIEILTNLAEGTCLVATQRTALEQVIVNLAVNARDAMPEGGSVTIATERIAITSPAHGDLPPGPYVQLVVSDMGQGMAPDVAARAFDPFFTTKDLGRGTGLGLSIIYGIVQKAEGRVTLETAPGEGTRVSILLPAASSRTATVPPPPRVARRGSGQSILVVEDEGAVGRVVERVLSEAGYHVIEAASALEALAIVGSSQVLDLVLTDVIMPNMGGPAMALRVAELRPTLPILYMSGYAGDELSRHGLTETAPEILQKPFSEVDLLEAVARELDRRGVPEASSSS